MSKLDKLEKQIKTIQANKDKELKPEAMLYFLFERGYEKAEIMEDIDIRKAAGLNELYRRCKNG